MQKLGMKPVPNISRVTIKKSKNVCASLESILRQSMLPAVAWIYGQA